MNTTFYIGNTRYELSEPNGRIPRQITRIAPYDETEYHWAYSNPAGDRWTVCTPEVGLTVCTVDTDLPEEVARICKERDTAAGLKRRGGIW